MAKPLMALTCLFHHWNEHRIDSEGIVGAGVTDFEAGLLRRLDGIEARLTAISQTDAQRRMLVEIASTTAATTFSVAELLRHAEKVPTLHAALLASLGSEQTARRAGKALARLQGQTVAGVSVERVGDEGGVALWRVCFAKPLLPVALAVDAIEHGDSITESLHAAAPL